LLVDWVVGDPNSAWHPVRLLGRYALTIENQIYSRINGRLAGLFAFTLVVGTAIGSSALLLYLARRLHPTIEFAVGILAVYASIAPRDLASHAQRVARALAKGDLCKARKAVGAIVGRDTEVLDEAGVCRATVETVAESTVDGVIAPLFWACVIGPLGAVGYRAVNTLDSLWGHKNARYERFGFVAARADDIANYIPARLTLSFITVAALFTRGNARAAFTLGLRHGSRHASPNSGLSEAAFAGALDVTLGGKNRYDGEWCEGASFGTSPMAATQDTIQRAIQLMWATTSVALVVFTLSLMTYATIIRR
jgi:adenosylcobinamide-phosphate synthase